MATGVIHPDTFIGPVALTVSDLDRSVAFYRDSLGMQLHRRDGDTAWLGDGTTDLLELTGVPAARRMRGTTGLYHFAILVPTRADLARVLAHLVATHTPLQGLSDHGVSEAIYLADPDGNGIEVYRDRPRDEWPRAGRELRMVTEPMDVDGVMSALTEETREPLRLPPGTKMGHVHLHVSDLAAAEDFYAGVLGFELMQHFGGQAAFLSAGGYHHHVGLNTWAGVGAPAPPPGAIGLREFLVQLPNEEELDRVAARIRNAGIPLERTGRGRLVRDPSGNAIILSAGPDSI